MSGRAETKGASEPTRLGGSRLIAEGDPLPEGSRVMVYAEDEEGGFHLDEDSIRELIEAQAEIRRGNFVTAYEP